MNRTQFLATLGCYPDANGNMPCENGVVCDRCITREAMEEWLKVKDDKPMEITTTLGVWQVCPNCPCNSCDEDCDVCHVHCEPYQAWSIVRDAFDKAEELAAMYLDGKYRKIIAQ